MVLLFQPDLAEQAAKYGNDSCPLGRAEGAALVEDREENVKELWRKCELGHSTPGVGSGWACRTLRVVVMVMLVTDPKLDMDMKMHICEKK